MLDNKYQNHFYKPQEEHVILIFLTLDQSQRIWRTI